MAYMKLSPLRRGSGPSYARHWPRVWDYQPNRDSPAYWYGPLDPTGEALLIEWNRTNEHHDGPLSGVLADWVEETRDCLLDGATGPSDPAVRLDALIRYLRDRFSSHQVV